MHVQQTRPRDVRSELARFVGGPCKVTRTGTPYDGSGTFATNDVDCRLMKCPELGTALLLQVGQSQLIRTSPIAQIQLADPSGLVVIVCTQDARYRLVFER